MEPTISRDEPGGKTNLRCYSNSGIEKRVGKSGRLPPILPIMAISLGVQKIVTDKQPGVDGLKDLSGDLSQYTQCRNRERIKKHEWCY